MPANVRHKRRLFVLALLSGATIEEASMRAGVSTRTGSRWANDPMIRAMIDAELARIEEHIIDQLVAGAGEGVAVLRRLLGSSDERLALRAADRLVQHYLTWVTGQRRSGVDEQELEHVVQLIERAVTQALRDVGLGDREREVRERLAAILQRGVDT